jgi:hypothetical protein
VRHEGCHTEARVRIIPAMLYRGSLEATAGHSVPKWTKGPGTAGVYAFGYSL